MNDQTAGVDVVLVSRGGTEMLVGDQEKTVPDGTLTSLHV